MRSPAWGPLYLIAGAGQANFDDHAARVRAALEAGVSVIQLREKGLAGDELRRRAEKLRDLAALYDCPFVVNDDPELARDLAADGLHLGQDDAAPSRARERVGARCLIGWSTHSTEQLRAAQQDPEVDLVGIGPVFPTTTKDAGPAIGVEVAARAAQFFSRGPAYAIGGIDAAGARQLKDLGVERIAVASAILGAADPGAVTAQLLDILRP
jgi:thiamine-phosphate diphosphorylase